MKLTVKVTLLFTAILYSASISAQDDGATLFKSTCAACHTVGKGRLVGPDLANVHNRKSEDWIMTFIRSSQSVINGGDEYAVALFEEYNKVPMPDQNLTDDQIKSILDHIKSNSPEETAATETEEVEEVKEPEPAEPERTITQKDIDMGGQLFAGHIRLANGGPTCNSCHHVKNDNVVGGGSLAKELTQAYSRLTMPGIKGILGNPPFPKMKAAYEKHPLTEEEVFQISAFLKEADEQHIYQHSRDYGQRMLYTGIIGAFILMGIFPALWFRRKSKAVNKRIYDRQIVSSN